eukprot:5184547-Ditylum_brightwellii.AAC.1
MRSAARHKFMCKVPTWLYIRCATKFVRELEITAVVANLPSKACAVNLHDPAMVLITTADDATMDEREKRWASSGDECLR